MFVTLLFSRWSMSYFYTKVLNQETPSYPVSLFINTPQLNARNKTKKSEKLLGKTFKLNRINLCSESCFVRNLHTPHEQNIRKIKVDAGLHKYLTSSITRIQQKFSSRQCYLTVNYTKQTEKVNTIITF